MTIRVTESTVLMVSQFVHNYRILVYKRSRRFIPFCWHIGSITRYDNGTPTYFRRIYRLTEWGAFNAACNRIERDIRKESAR